MRQTITTKAWTDAGYGFDLWLRYAQAKETKQIEIENAFWAKHGEQNAQAERSESNRG